MARANITPAVISSIRVIEPDAVTLGSDGGALPNASCILRLDNSAGGSAINAVIVGNLVVNTDGDTNDQTIAVPAGDVVYVRVTDTTDTLQSDGTLHINGSGLAVQCFTLAS